MSVKCPKCGNELRYVNSIHTLVCNSCGFSEALPALLNTPTTRNKRKTKNYWKTSLELIISGVICLLVALVAITIFGSIKLPWVSTQETQIKQPIATPEIAPTLSTQSQEPIATPDSIIPEAVATPQTVENEISQNNNDNYLDNPSQDTANQNTTLSYEKLILGRWVFKQSLYPDEKIVSSFPYRLETEYFEDKTFIVQTEYPTFRDLDSNENGEWIILSDGRLKRSYERCTETSMTKKCRTITDINKIHFPDSNTLKIDYSDSTNVFKRKD